MNSVESSSGWNFFSSQSWKVWYVTVRKGAQLMFITLDKNTLCHLCSYKSTNNYDISLLSTFPSAWRGTEVYLLKERRENSHFMVFLICENKRTSFHAQRPKENKCVCALSYAKSNLSNLRSKKWFVVPLARISEQGYTNDKGTGVWVGDSGPLRR